MATPDNRLPDRDPYLTVLRIGTIVSVVVSGTIALMAFIFGSPLEFGVALAICAAWWITDDLIAATAQGGRLARDRVIPGKFSDHPGHIVLLGRGRRFSGSSSHTGAGSTAA